MLTSIVLYNLFTAGALLGLVFKNPRFMMGDYPEEITVAIPPQTDQEKKGSLIYGLPFLLMLVFFPLVIGFVGKFTQQIDFTHNILRIFILFISFNLVDLLLLDWLIFCTITPPFMVLPETEGHPGYKNYRFHFIGFLKGSLFCILGSVGFAVLIEGVYAIFLIFK